MSRRRIAGRVLALSLMASGVALLAVLGVWLAADAGEGRATGILVAVESRSIGWAEAVELLTPDGRRLRFRVARTVDQTPGHLREHMTYGELVVVHYRREDGVLVARAILDRDAAPHPTVAPTQTGG